MQTKDVAGRQEEPFSGVQGPRCRVCGKPLYGRPDKRFCSNRCKNIFNNSKYREQRRLLDSFNSALRANYFLLKQMFADGRRHCPKNDLLSAGFAPDCYNSVIVTPLSKWYRCFDLCYRIGFKFVYLRKK
jgi:predicted nucleic acid-binding Zn ribbon protein